MANMDQSEGVRKGRTMFSEFEGGPEETGGSIFDSSVAEAASALLGCELLVVPGSKHQLQGGTTKGKVDEVTWLRRGDLMKAIEECRRGEKGGGMGLEVDWKSGTITLSKAKR